MSEDIQERLDWAVETCRERGLRRTNAMREVLRELIAAKEPRTLADLCESEKLRDTCDRVTVFRLLGRLVEKRVIRRLGFHERAAYYVFSYPDECNDFLVCTDCGKIEPLNIKCPVESLEKEVMASSGFQAYTMSLNFSVNVLLVLN